MAEERRKSVRIKKVFTARYSYGSNKDEKKWDITLIKDISEKGMCVNTHREFFPNDIITFLIKIPFRPLDWVEFIGRVIASEKLMTVSGESVAGSHVTRVEFINLKDDQRQLIREYINWFLTKEGGG